MDAALFKQHFPEFANTPDAQIDYWSRLAVGMVRRCVWRDKWPHGVELFTAHYLFLTSGYSGTPGTGGAGGGQGGVVSAKSVDKVSVSFDVSVSAEENAGHWNESTYGRMYIRLARMFGAGGVQL